MSKRNPNDPIPGFEEEFTGTVGHEKRIHKTHFQGVNVRPTHQKDDPNWEYLGMGRWRMKRIIAGAMSAGGSKCISNPQHLSP